MSSLKQKNCLIIYRSKKLNDFAYAGTICDAFSDRGYYFDEIKYAAFDDADIIAGALTDSVRYENLVVVCPQDMHTMLSSYISELYSSSFDGTGVLRKGDKIVCLLNSDGENRLKYDDIIKIFDGKYGVSYNKLCLCFVGAPDECISRAVAGVKSACPELSVSVSGSFGAYKLEIIYSDKTPKVSADSAVRAALTELKDYVYSLEDLSLAEVVYRLLKLRRMRLSVAESFTGGGVAKKLVDIPGVSEVYFEGVNTYSNESKMKRLGVKELTLKQYGAVSDETAYEMAAGLLGTGDCDAALSTTGIAGPKSDNTLKPVGLIYIGVGTADGISVYKYNLGGDRETVTETAINLALFHLYKTLK